MAAAWWCVAGYKVWRNIHTCKQESKCLKKRYCIAVHEWTNELRNYLCFFFLVWIDVVSHQVIDVPLSVPSRSQTEYKLCVYVHSLWWFRDFSTLRGPFLENILRYAPHWNGRRVGKKPAVCGQFRRIFSRSSKKNLWIARSGNITSRWICSIPVPCILWSYLAPVFLEMSWSGEYKHQWHQRFNFAVEVYVLDGPSFEETYRQSGSELPRKAGAGFRTELV